MEGTLGEFTRARSHSKASINECASPGRFFVAHELKIMFAHLFMNYDIKPITERPVQIWVGRTSLPPKVDIEICKRKTQRSN